MLKTFGYVNENLPKVATPTGEPCFRCGGVIKDKDRGVVMPHMELVRVVDKPWHLDCLREALGLVTW